MHRREVESRDTNKDKSDRLPRGNIGAKMEKNILTIKKCVIFIALSKTIISF